MRAEGPIGRQRELSRVDAFLAAAPAGVQARAITGPAGIGKTRVWAEGVRRAGERGWTVLSAAPSGAEARLSYAGLTDLLASVEASSFDALPGMQQRALEVALVRADAGPGRFEGRAVAAGVLSLLRGMAATGPVLVAVDDAQWLDAASGEALGFAVRRLLDAPVGVLVGVRVEHERPSTFERAVPSERREDVELGPLSVAVLHDVLKAELGTVFPRPTLVRIAAACDGNPFYALEIARELQRVGVPSGAAPLPLPEEVRMLARTRLERLPEETREALLVASCLSRPTIAHVDVAALAPAEESGVVHFDGRQIRFAHPLLASAVYDAAPAASRRRVHRWLADRVDDPEERARHLARIADGPDEDVAQALDAAAVHAAARGASASAAELGRRALDLTAEASGEIRVRRSLAVAHYLLDAGDSDEARAVLEACEPAWVEGDLRAELLFQLGRISWYEREFERGYEMLVVALEGAESAKLAARIHVEAAWLAQDSDPARAIEHDAAALELLDPDESPGRYSNALLHGTYLRMTTGQGADQEAYERGVALQKRVEDWEDKSPVLGMWPLVNDDFARARSLYEAGLERARAEGDEPSVQGVLIRLAEIELWTGHWTRADVLAAEGMELADRVSSRAYLGSALHARGYVDAHLGRGEEARSAGEQILELYPKREGQRALGHWLLGFLALSMDDPVGADDQLTRTADLIEAFNQREPARFRFHPDHVEAVIQLGDLERAEALLAALEERARIFPRPWILATTVRCRGLLLSARGDLDGAREAMEEALEHHACLDMPFERARTLLAFGQLLRRRKERLEARAAIEEALAVFDELPAPLWAKRARAELARMPRRRAPRELTATEETIAQLAGTGLTNRAIAKRIFLSQKTVESNLARVYRKLGIGSRAELGRVMAERDRVGT